MKIINALLVVFLILPTLYFAQVDLNGLWQGIVIQQGQKIEQGTPIFLQISIKKNTVEGKTREEVFNSDLYAIKKIKLEVKGNEVNFKQTLIEKKKTSSKVSWCLFEAKLKYNDSTGYLEGKYLSTDCKRIIGKMIFYRSKMKFSDNETPIQTHFWLEQFRKDLQNGEKAPEIRELERKNFVFQPIYFDYDKAEIKEEYVAFLTKLIKVVNGHSDLRIKVVGNTDSDGSDSYNIDLSRRRAEAITNFFVSHGLRADRIKIEFNGENKPVDNNKTEEGKQKNRRVEFEFI